MADPYAFWNILGGGAPLIEIPFYIVYDKFGACDGALRLPWYRLVVADNIALSIRLVEEAGVAGFVELWAFETCPLFAKIIWVSNGTFHFTKALLTTFATESKTFETIDDNRWYSGLDIALATWVTLIQLLTIVGFTILF